MMSEVDSNGTETLTWSRIHLGATVEIVVTIPKGVHIAGALAAFFALEGSVEQMLLAMLPLDSYRPGGAVVIDQPKTIER